MPGATGGYKIAIHWLTMLIYSDPCANNWHVAQNLGRAF
jgi:hypothetical protein